MTELIRAISDRNPGVPATKAGARDAPRSRRSIFSLTLGDRFHRLALYIAMGWVALVAIGPLVEGAFREHRLNATGLVAPGQRCAVVVEVFAPDVFSDLAIHFVDWSPDPPDDAMGLWMPARVETTGPVALRDPAVTSRLGTDGSADLTLLATLANGRDAPATARLSGRIDGRDFATDVALGAGETREVALTPADLPALRLATPRLRWPWAYGEPHPYRLDLEVSVDGAASDAATLDVGVRQVTA